MEQQLTIYNTLNRKKELFVPLHAPHVGMYVCGPTVYGDAHLGHARPAITFDLLFRYLTHIGYKVRYVRNITYVGHLEHYAVDGEYKFAKKARRHGAARAIESMNYTGPGLCSVERNPICGRLTKRCKYNGLNHQDYSLSILQTSKEFRHADHHCFRFY